MAVTSHENFSFLANILLPGQQQLSAFARQLCLLSTYLETPDALCSVDMCDRRGVSIMPPGDAWVLGEGECEPTSCVGVPGSASSRDQVDPRDRRERLD